MEENKRLTEHQYYKFRTLANDIIIAKMKQEYENSKKDLLAKDIEIMKLKHIIMSHQVKAMSSAITFAENCYVEFKKELEELLNISLEECVIDDYTYEVKKLKE